MADLVDSPRKPVGPPAGQARHRRLIEKDGVPSYRVSLIPNAVIPASDDPPDLTGTLPDGWLEGPLVGVVARLQPEKGVADFLKAAVHVSKITPQVRFLVVGDGPLREELLALAKRIGVEKRVRFLGHRTDAQALIGFMEVLVVPSVTEGSPLIVLEAMAAGVPVVASAVGGIPDQIRHDKEGLLVPPGDTGALGEALLNLLRDPACARRLGEAGRRRATSEFAHPTMVRRIEDVYRDALGRPASRSSAPEEPELRTTR